MHMVDMESASSDYNCNKDENPQKYRKMGTSVLDSFTKLTSEDEKTRVEGGTTLLRHLSQQKSDDPESKELDYSLRRLIRGLGGSRLSSRRGFYATLTAYLKLHPETEVNSLLETMETELKSSGHNSKSENADIFMGRILFCGSLIRSKLLESSPPDFQQKVIEILLQAGSKRSYLSFSCSSFLLEFLHQLTPKSLKISIWPILERELGKPWSEQTLDTFYTLLIMSTKFPTLVNKKFLREHLGTDSIIDEKSLDSQLKLLTDIPRIVCHRHPLYPIFCEQLVSSNYLIPFWTGLDKRFVKPSRTIEHLSLEILNLIVTNIKDKTLLPALLTPNFLHHMLKRFTSNKRNKHDDVANAFKKFLSHLVTQLDDKELKSKTAISVIKKLVMHPGDLMIEKITGTKILQMITSNLDTNGVKKLSKFYNEIVSNSVMKRIKEREEPWTNSERTYVGQLLSKLLGHPAVASEQSWRLEQLKLLFTLGLCETSNVGVELAPVFKESFYRALDHKLPKLDDLKSVLTELITQIDKELFDEKTKNLRTPLPETAVDSWKKVISFIKKPEKSFKNKHAVLIFYTMDLNMGLQLFSDPEMAISAINEIHCCADRLKSSKSPKKQNAQAEDEEPVWVEVIVDLLLSLLSRNSHLLRSLVRCVFPHVCPLLTSTSIHQILAALDPKDDKGPLRKGSGDSDSSSDEDQSDDDKSDEEEQSDEEEEVSEASDDDDVDEDETITDKLRLAVRQALGEASAQTDDEDVDIDDIDEEEGKRLDESLAAAFKILRENRSNKNKKQGKSAEALTHFRVRVMDLLEIYLDSEPSMALALDMLVPLFALLEFCIKDSHQKPLENRVRSCLKKLSGVKKFRDTEGVDEQLIEDLGKLLVEKGERSTLICQEMGDKLAECCTFLIRCVQQARLASDTLVRFYGENFTAFFKKRDCVLPATLFRNALQLNWEGNWELVPLIVDYAFDGSIRSFRRGQALEFLTTFYKNHRLISSGKGSVKETMERTLARNCLSLFEELREGQVNGEGRKEVRQKFLGVLWRLLHAVHSQQMEGVWDWGKIGEAIAGYRKGVSLSKDAKTAYNRLATLIGAPKNIQDEGDRKQEINGVHRDSGVRVEDESAESGDEQSIKKSKKEIKKKLKNLSKKKEKQMLKKEARELRAKAMGEGLDGVEFSSVVLNGGNEGMENGVGEDNRTLGKKRSASASAIETPVKSKKKKGTK
ncbi:DNA polymerase V [Fopius arisanus]|uniref:DNA polymerase V n=1 Tax=Fopius arisanus TaxID=64838 RepID=A0A9R1SVD3_9HYME|nr:PREDICTED: DNA polymerase V [Fopius arisanus]